MNLSTSVGEGKGRYCHIYIILACRNDRDPYNLSTVPTDFSCQPGFNNSLNHGDCLRWRTLRDALAGN